jgi:hypothetical protein
LKYIRTSITVILLIATITITVTTSIQTVFAPGQGGCDACGPFLKLTAQFEKDVSSSILEFAVENHPNNYLEFRQLTAEFKTDVMNALLSNPQEPEKIPEFHKVYTDGVLRIFLGGPDTIPGLLENYGRGVTSILTLDLGPE